MKIRKRLSLLGIFLFGTVFFISVFMVSKILIGQNRAKQEFEALSRLAEAERALTKEQDKDKISGSPYAALKSRNPDFFGWLSIEGTTLDYPVMYTPADAEKYLHKGFDEKDSKSGVPFLDAACREGCGNYLIYGHNMKNGSMFAPLLSYADSAYWEEHRTISFDTLEGDGEYEVVAAFYSQIYPQDAIGVFRFYRYTDVSNPAVFLKYMEQVQAAALYDTNVTAKPGDRLLTLSTCSYHKKDGRFVVVARQTAARP